MKKLLLTALVGLSLTAFAEPQTLKYASFLPATTSNNAVTLPKVKAKLEAESGGALSVEYYFGGTLGAGAKTQMRLVQNGVADAAEIPVPYNPGRIQGIDVFELPNLSKDNSDASLITMKMIEKGDMRGLGDFIVLARCRPAPTSSTARHPSPNWTTSRANASASPARCSRMWSKPSAACRSPTSRRRKSPRT